MNWETASESNGPEKEGYVFEKITPCANFLNCLSFLRKQESIVTDREAGIPAFAGIDRKSCTPRKNRQVAGSANLKTATRSFATCPLRILSCNDL
jgi:hypothetical protein